ncbi:uncharacterized protein LOC127149015 isoform X2 [Cucumis melo]|uniref:Uncharacterized protein LOC127149015 isoform X2 n=1 Tax=Cucumis melo TaxID=3656 RepID=A0ABM3KP24_CUCME|nr:uncharacterized protein LOC127149015 isoform X2 [Cucumis melo]
MNLYEIYRRKKALFSQMKLSLLSNFVVGKSTTAWNCLLPYSKRGAKMLFFPVCVDDFKPEVSSSILMTMFCKLQERSNQLVRGSRVTQAREELHGLQSCQGYISVRLFMKQPKNQVTN